jgi:uncharacterized protein YxjI
MKINYLYILLSISTVFLTVACSSKKDETQIAPVIPQGPLKASFQQVDSIMIDVIGNLDIYDYQPESNLFLGGDIRFTGIAMIGSGTPKGNVLGHLVINREGEIVHQFKHTDQGPDGHGTAARDNFFLGSNTIGVYGRLGLLQYELDGKFLKKHKSIDLNNLAGINMGRVAFAMDSILAIGMSLKTDESDEKWDSLYQIIKPLRFYDLSKFKTGLENEQVGLIEAHGFPNHPVYEFGSELPHNPFPPLMTLNRIQSELYAVYPEVPVLEVYDMKTGVKKNEINLEPEHFKGGTELKKAEGGVKGYAGLLWSNKGGKMANSLYHEIVEIGEYTLLRYSTAIPEQEINQLVAGDGLKDEKWPSIRRQHYKFYYQLFKDGKKVVPDFGWPALTPQVGDVTLYRTDIVNGKIIGGAGLDEIFVFIPNQGEEERDYELIKVFKLNLSQ